MTTYIIRPLGGTLLLNTTPLLPIQPATAQVLFRDGKTNATFRDGNTQVTFRDGAVKVGER